LRPIYDGGQKSLGFLGPIYDGLQKSLELFSIYDEHKKSLGLLHPFLAHVNPKSCDISHIFEQKVIKNTQKRTNNGQKHTICAKTRTKST
jgi:hypothetical protein